MYYISELKGKRIIDGAGVYLGDVDGANLAYPEYRVSLLFLRVDGDKLFEVRGRKREFISVDEIDLIEKDIHLYKEFQSLTPEIKKVHMEEFKQVFRAIELIGEDVFSFDGVKVGKVKDISVGKRDRKAFLIVEGPLIKDIRGRSSEAIPISEVTEIGDEIHINLTVNKLGELVAER